MNNTFYILVLNLIFDTKISSPDIQINTYFLKNTCEVFTSHTFVKDTLEVETIADNNVTIKDIERNEIKVSELGLTTAPADCLGFFRSIECMNSSRTLVISKIFISNNLKDNFQIENLGIRSNINKNDRNIHNGDERTMINTFIGKLIMQLNVTINAINIDSFNMAHSLNSIRIFSFSFMHGR